MTRIERPESLAPIVDQAHTLVRSVEQADARISHNGNAGTGYVIPKTHSLTRAASDLARAAEAEQETTRIVHRVTNKHFYPACFALARVLETKYGVNFASPQQSMFGKVDPVDITFPIDHQTMTTVTLGQFKLHDMTIQTERAGEQLVIHIRCTNLDKPTAIELCNYVDTADDVWKGKCLDFPTDGDRCPTITMPTNTVDSIALNPSEEAALQLFLNQIEHHEELDRDHGIRFKRGVLMYGQWGTGKTLAATVAMAACIRNGITVLYERDWSKLEETLTLARHMAPAMVFCEDIERIRSRSLINILDDATLKTAAVSLVVTTNEPEKLDPALTRTGRLDIAIGFKLPEPDTRAKILAINGAPHFNDEIAAATDGMTGSDLAEIAKRAITNAVCARKPMDDAIVLGSAHTMHRPPQYVAPKPLEDHLTALFNAMYDDSDVQSRMQYIADTADNIEHHTCE